MKKLFIIASAVVVAASCSPDYITNDDGINSSKIFTPPDWIQGTWVTYYGEGDDSNGTPVFRFTNDDFCILSAVSIESCWKSAIENNHAQNPPDELKTTVEQQISENKYSFTIVVNGGAMRQNYKFEKITDSKILYISGSELGNATLVKQ